MLCCITIAKVQEGKMPDVVKAAKAVVMANKQLDGYIYYNVLSPADKADTIVLSEGWESMKCFEAHFETDAFKAFMAVTGTCFAAPPDVYLGEDMV